MQISQADFRTVRIIRGAASFLLRYSLYQDGEERLPESIVCRGDTVVAYFLTSTIRDFILSEHSGFSVQRSWKIVPEGAFALSFCLDILDAAEIPCLFPGIYAAQTIPQQPFLASGVRTAYANALYLFSEPESILIFSDPPRSAMETGSIELKRHSIEEETLLRTEVRIPAALSREGEQAAKTAKKNPLPDYFQSNGDFEYALRLNVVTAPPQEIHKRAITAVLERNRARFHPPRRISAVSIGERIRKQIRDCLDMFLVDRSPLCGLRAAERSSTLSSAASCTMALLLRRFCRDDAELAELALRLADFALTGQHPSGLFYPTYHLDRRSWLEVDKDPEDPPEPSIERSAAVAVMLAALIRELRAQASAAGRYLHAVTRLADALLASANQPGGLLHPDSYISTPQGDGAPSLVELLLQVYELTAKDAYKKALSALTPRFCKESVQTIPISGWDGRSANLEPALQQAHAAVLLAGSQHTVRGLNSYFVALLPWLHLNYGDPEQQFNTLGGLHSRLDENRLVFRGFEMAYLLMKINACIGKDRRLKSLGALISRLVSFTLQKPMGTSFYAPEETEAEKFGAVDCTIWVRELLYLTRLHEEFPQVFQHP